MSLLRKKLSNGRTAKALRTVVSAIAGRTVRVDLIETDEAR